MTEQTLYENRPGGTIVRLVDGTGHTVSYGTAYAGTLTPENLDPLIRQGLHEHADTTPRLSSEDEALAMARDAHARAALAENGNVNSGQSSVPSNYGDLDEDTAAVLMMNLARYPERQASLVQHEILYGGNRRKVIDAASEIAFLSAQARIAALMATQKPQLSVPGPPVTSPGDPDIAPGDLARSVQLERAAAAALGAQSLKDASIPRAAPSPIGSTPPAPGGTQEADAISAEATSRADAREAALNEREAQLNALEARISAQRETPTAGLTGQGSSDQTAGTGVQPDPLASRRTAPDGGEAPASFDGESGVNSPGYFSNSDLDKYAKQHEIAGVDKAGNRKEKLAALAMAGHTAPETPKS